MADPATAKEQLHAQLKRLVKTLEDAKSKGTWNDDLEDHYKDIKRMLEEETTPHNETSIA